MSTDMHQILGRQIQDDNTAITKSKEGHFLKIFLLSATLRGEFQMKVANGYLLPNFDIRFTITSEHNLRLCSLVDKVKYLS
jgi:hypothetical protein